MVSNNLPITTEQLRAFSDLCGGRTKKVLVIHFDGGWVNDPQDQMASLQHYGFRDLIGYQFENVESGSNGYYAELVAQVNGIVVVGHDDNSALRLCDRDLRQRIFGKFIERGGIMFGIGPGAIAVGDKMLIGNNPGPGLSIFDGIITTDYYANHKEIHLRNAYFGSRLQLGIGLNRDEWLVFRDGVIEKKVGSPQVFLRE